MSRIGRLPIAIPSGVTVKIDENTVAVKGPLGELTRTIDTKISAKTEDGKILVSRASDDKEMRAKHGLYRALINNMILGVTKGFGKKLVVSGVGYKCAVAGNKLTMNIGFSHAVEVIAAEGINITCPTPNEIEIKGIDKELVGQFAANIRDIKRVEPYHGYGIRYFDEVVIHKEGKKAAK